jgi:hypothetical protein
MRLFEPNLLLLVLYQQLHLDSQPFVHDVAPTTSRLLIVQQQAEDQRAMAQTMQRHLEPFQVEAMW